MPAVLVLGDGEADAERGRRGAEQSGCGVSDTVGIEEAVDRLDRQAAVSTVVVELDRDHGAVLDRLLDRLEAAARADRHGSVVAVPPELIDLVAARTPHAGVHHLCGATELERVAAIAFASAPRPKRLHDVRRSQGIGLQQLSEEVGRIASILASLSEGAEASEAPARPSETEKEGEITAGQVRTIIRARRLRDRYFHADLFADPAWDMQLDLLAARLADERVAVSSLCVAAAVPPPTALRWIKTLCERSEEPTSELQSLMRISYAVF